MNWRAEAEKWHSKACETLQKCGAIPFMLRTYPFPNDNCVVWEETEGLSDDARLKLMVTVRLFRLIQPAAVLFQADVVGTNNVDFGRYFGFPADLPFEEYQRRYHHILREQFDGRISNLPKELQLEQVLTVLKGPKLPPLSYGTSYRREGDKIVVEKDQIEGYGILNIVPDWWETTVQ